MRRQAFGIQSLAAFTISLLLGLGTTEAQDITPPPPVNPLPTSIVSWGWDDSGKLGDGNPIADQTSPVPVTLRDPRAISAGASHGLAIRAGGVWAWGNNDYEQLGGASHWSCHKDSSGTVIIGCPSPVRVTALSGVSAVSAGFVHSLALKQDHTVWAWGQSLGGLNATVTRSAQPVEVTGLITGTYLTSTYVYPTAVSAGSGYSLARRSDGSVWSWGLGGWGQLGTGSFNDNATPERVMGPTGIKVLSAVADIDAGEQHALARKVDGTVWAWGRADFGQLGDGPRAPQDFRSNRPVQVKVEVPTPFGGSTLQPLSDITAIAAGQGHSLALKSDGTVWAWGSNSNGQLGDGTYDDRYTAVPVITLVRDRWGNAEPFPLRDVVAIAAGRLHSLALRADGTVWAWGNNGDAYSFRRGYLGTGHLLDVSSPTPEWVTDVVGAIAIAAGHEFSLAITCSTFATKPEDCDGDDGHVIEPQPIPVPRPPIIIIR
jgi:alpha-tubulin suppressor-like RCC1 family protein